jgi:hypothetical protein
MAEKDFTPILPQLVAAVKAASELALYAGEREKLPLRELRPQLQRIHAAQAAIERVEGGHG